MNIEDALGGTRRRRQTERTAFGVNSAMLVGVPPLGAFRRPITVRPPIRLQAELQQDQFQAAQAREISEELLARLARLAGLVASKIDRKEHFNSICFA